MELLYRKDYSTETAFFGQFVLGGIQQNEYNSWIDEGSNIYNLSPKDITTNSKMLSGATENVLQKLLSPLTKSKKE